MSPIVGSLVAALGTQVVDHLLAPAAPPASSQATASGFAAALDTQTGGVERVPLTDYLELAGLHDAEAVRLQRSALAIELEVALADLSLEPGWTDRAAVIQQPGQAAFLAVDGQVLAVPAPAQETLVRWGELRELEARSLAFPATPLELHAAAVASSPTV